MRQPRAKDRSLDLVEPRIHAELIVIVTPPPSAVLKNPDAICQRGVARDDGAAVAQGAEILRGIEAERARDADGPNRTAIRRREVGLAAVLDDRQAVAERDALNAGHVGGLAVQVHRHDGARPRSDEPFDLRGIDGEPY